MIRFIAIIFALTVATSADAMSPAPLHPSDGMVMQVREACGVGRVRINGVCVAELPSAMSAEKSAGVHDGMRAFASVISET
jgi:hypothetical protein